MATLVLSTVGTALGGPVGAAIGALIGQSIDQQLLGGSRRGPRLGDLSVQTSSYGTQLPKIFGTMRVAGSVIWSTDLVEGAATSGAKGQPDTVYSYSVSLAVALASRPIAGIGRIWADGKLVRGADGVFKVNTAFRLYDGGEQQEIDPLIGSVEGIASTPAYRGLAYAVFENLELVEFGNRIPFLTFEILADDGAPTLATILGETSGGAIDCDAAQQLTGYAAYGQSIRAAVEPLVDAFGLELFDDGFALRTASGGPLTIAEDELGNSADSDRAARMQREQMPASSLPAALRLSFYDPDRDYQAGEARASTGEQHGSEEHVELAAALGSAAAKTRAQEIIARRWQKRDKLTVRLPPRYAALDPGARLLFPDGNGNWTVQRCTVDGFVVIAELRPSSSAGIAVPATAATLRRTSIAAVDDDLTLALFDAPLEIGDPGTEPTLFLAASSTAPAWRSVAVEIGTGSRSIMTRTPARKAVLGRALSVLGPGGAYLIDMRASVDVELLNSNQWLVSCDDEGLATGFNLALVGDELVQFGDAVPLGPGRFRLSRLLRGRRGTEWASPAHEIGDRFVLIEPEALRAIRLPDWTRGAIVSAVATRNGRILSEASAQVTAEALRPPAPVHVQTEVTGNGDLDLSWARRSRRGWAWIDEVDAPLGEANELYRVSLIGPAACLDLETGAPQMTISASQLSRLGAGPMVIQVRQIGDRAASHPTEQHLILR